MPKQTGTYSLDDLLDVRFAVVSIAEFGMDTLAEIIQNDIAAHNAIVQELMDEFATPTDDLQRIYGTAIDGQMTEVDEFGRGPTQLDRPGDTVGFPLKRYQFALGWTRMYLQLKSVQDMAIATATSEKAHINAIRREIKRALFLSANYSFVDFNATKTTLAVKRLLNADSAPIPPGPNGEIFVAASHTHYNSSATLTNAAVAALITDVVEHGHGGKVMIAIAQADEAAWRALTDFKAYVDVRLTPVAGQPSKTVDNTRIDNRAIGIIGAAEVWVKPWAIANYAIAWDASDPNKPLAMRQRPQAALRGLRLAGEIEAHPLQTQYMEADFGFGVWTRTNGAVLYYANASYADPTIT